MTEAIIQALRQERMGDLDQRIPGSVGAQVRARLDLARLDLLHGRTGDALDHVDAASEILGLFRERLSRLDEMEDREALATLAQETPQP